MLKTFLIFWDRLSHIGIGEQLDHSDARRSILINQIAFCLTLNAFSYVVIFIYYNFPLLLPLIILNFCVSICYPVVFLLNHFSKYTIALNAFYFIVINHILGATYFLGSDSGIHLFCFAVIASIFILLKDRFWRSFFLLSSIIIYFISEFLFIPETSIVKHEAFLLEMLFISTSIIVFFFICLTPFLSQIEIDRAEKLLEEEYKKSDELLLNIFPKVIVDRLKLKPDIIADKYAETTVLFADIVGFTQYSSSVLPSQLVAILNDIFSIFDDIIDEYNLEKIKTIGDAYMVVGGMHSNKNNHAEAIADAALKMKEEIKEFNSLSGENFNIRIGIHSGPTVAGVIGKKKYSYDIWGDAVNVASRMESQGESGKTHVSEITYSLLKDKYRFEERGVINIKGKGDMKTYFLIDKSA